FVTNVLGFEEKNDNFNHQFVGVKPEMISSPIKGEIVPLTEVNEPLFATSTVGTGFAIQPVERKVESNVYGTATKMFPTHHALDITSENGAEILIYVGLDTVKLKGQYFHVHLKKSDEVKQGDLLMEFDMENLQKAGYEILTPIIITNTEEYL